ncbi:Holliday junction resolvase RecU [Spiroplasma alleghenense]|uniref:Holliday junction resolvase RecU n=1 Tax=Spiroplasma alleghenense TaxID=216931 RepID=A0A345Z486_9MOLU|nr:Holliday junction resolvase RecU [Spiroplasma alleghenense]AXK51415.1 Holliday junction-specific endonuclease [Spiroplasma alleghenense]
MNLILNKGMFLETIINHANEYYNDNNLALISKINVNINLIKVENKQITKANFTKNFNCDYIGVYKGVYLEFEAKETYKDYFSIVNLKPEQRKKLARVREHLGVAFLIIYFHNFNKYFIVDIEKIINLDSKDKKIPVSWLEENGYELFMNKNIVLDYLNGVNQLINCI